MSKYRRKFEIIDPMGINSCLNQLLFYSFNGHFIFKKRKSYFWLFVSHIPCFTVKYHFPNCQQLIRLATDKTGWTVFIKNEEIFNRPQSVYHQSCNSQLIRITNYFNVIREPKTKWTTHQSWVDNQSYREYKIQCIPITFSRSFYV